VVEPVKAVLQRTTFATFTAFAPPQLQWNIRAHACEI
jgi:hypothetical protein